MECLIIDRKSSFSATFSEMRLYKAALCTSVHHLHGGDCDSIEIR